MTKRSASQAAALGALILATLTALCAHSAAGILVADLGLLAVFACFVVAWMAPRQRD